MGAAVSGSYFFGIPDRACLERVTARGWVAECAPDQWLQVRDPHGRRFLVAVDRAGQAVCLEPCLVDGNGGIALLNADAVPLDT